MLRNDSGQDYELEEVKEAIIEPVAEEWSDEDSDGG